MIKVLNRWWRIVATGGCFFIFGVGGLLLSLFIFPSIELLPLNTRLKREKVQNIIQKSFRLFIWLMEILGVLRVEIEGLEELSPLKSQIVIANHPTLIDVIILMAYLENANCIVKQKLLLNPFLMGIVKSAGYIGNSDPQELIDDCLTAINNGNILIVFPEGTRTTPGQAIRFQRGAANLALRSGQDIKPVIITCNSLSLTKEKSWYQVPSEGRVIIRLKFGETIAANSFIYGAKSMSVASRQMTEYLQNYYQKEI